MAMLKIGDRFTSYEEFNETLNKYCEENNCQFWKRDVRSLKCMKTRVRRAALANQNLLYYSIKFCCIFGGKTFQKKKGSLGKRVTKTLKQGCEAFVHLTLGFDNESLVLTNLNLSHNHAITEKLFKLLPQKRRLPEEVQKKASDLMQLRVSKKILQAKLIKETGKTVLLKDLSNIAHKFKSASEPLENIVTLLKNNYKCTVDALHKDNTLHGLFFQDKQMSLMFNSYPEILLFDKIYKLLDNKLSCFIFLIEDGDCNIEVVGVGLISRDDFTSIKWLIDTFQDRNSQCFSTRIIITNKDSEEQTILKEKFPDAKLSFCSFHVMRAFNREVKKMNVTDSDLDIAKKCLTEMLYCKSEEQYQETYAKFVQSCPDAVTDYYNKNWHAIHQDWTHISLMEGLFFNTSNSGLEKIHSMFKSAIKSNKALTVNVENFFGILASQRTERDVQLAALLLKVSTCTYEKDSIEDQFATLLQPLPLQFVLTQIQNSCSTTLFEESPESFYYLNGDLKCTVDHMSCSCSFFWILRLPCNHIFSLRKLMNMTLFDVDLCNKRWTKSYASAVHRLSVGDSINEDCFAFAAGSTEISSKTQNERFCEVSVVTNELAHLVSESSGTDFQTKVKFIEDVISAWKAGKNLAMAKSNPYAKTEKHITPVSSDPSTQYALVPIISLPSAGTSKPSRENVVNNGRKCLLTSLPISSVDYHQSVLLNSHVDPPTQYIMLPKSSLPLLGPSR